MVLTKNSIITVKRNFRREYGTRPLSINSIKLWYTYFRTIGGSVADLQCTGRPKVTDEAVAAVREC